MLGRMNPSEKQANLAPTSPNAPDSIVDPSPVAPSSSGTEFSDVDEVLENNDKEPTKLQASAKSPNQAELKVHVSRLGVLEIEGTD